MLALWGGHWGELTPPDTLDKTQKIHHKIYLLLLSLHFSSLYTSKRANRAAHRNFSPRILSTKEPQLASRPWLPPADSRPHRP